MKTVVAFCAVLVCLGCGSAFAAPARTNAPTPFDEFVPRPPGSIPHVRSTRAAAMAPLPRPKPVGAPRSAPAAVPGGPVVFPPVTPLE
jgi:hypothetical protein